MVNNMLGVHTLSNQSTIEKPFTAQRAECFLFNVVRASASKHAPTPDTIYFVFMFRCLLETYISNKGQFYRYPSNVWCYQTQLLTFHMSNECGGMLFFEKTLSLSLETPSNHH